MQLASEKLRIADDGIDPGGLASAPFDGEGTPRGRTPLLGDGKLLAYLHDSYTARRGGAVSTGNAARASYRSAPSVSPSNLMIEPGELSLEGLLEAAGEGVYITEVAGLHSGVNPVTGRYSVGATGRAIRGGELAEPLREFTIAGDLLSTLAAVQAVGSEARWVPFGGLRPQRADPRRRDGDRRLIAVGLPSGSAVRLGAHSNPEEAKT